MSERTLKRILAGVAVLVAVYAAVALVRNGPGGAGEEGGGAVGELFSSLDPESVEEVRFERPDDTLRLGRSGDRWTVNGHPADSARVAGFWSGLEDARVGAPVARNPANHERLGVGEGAVRVVFRTGDGETREILVGDVGPAPPSAYVRLPGADAVHVVHADLRSPARRSLDDWRDRTVVRVDTARVRTLALVGDGGGEGETRTLTREDDGWSLEGAPADSAAVRGILGALANLRATGFAPDTAEIGEPGRRVVALDAGGDTLAVVSLAEREEPGYHVLARGDSVVYELTTYQGGRLFPEPDALRADPGEEDDAGGPP